MDFTEPEELVELAQKAKQFVIDKIIPFESDPRWGAHGPSEEMRTELTALAKEAELFAPHVAKDLGGLGLGHMGRAFVFEAAGYSMLGPIALHCAAPDEGNMHLLEVVASPEQRETYLKPLAQGARSCFAMTEPMGAGSDPGQLQTTATWDNGYYNISGKKWLITGAHGAAFTIIMARLEGGPESGEATMFLSPMERPEIEIERTLDTLDQSFAGGHCVVNFNNLRVSSDDILGEVGKGFRYAQVRLAPARLTHCMRWLGSAIRAHDIACAYANKREAFGKKLGKHEGVSFMLADNEVDIHTARLLIRHTAWLLDQGEKANEESSMAKVYCSEAIWRVVDRSLQILGGLGITGDSIMEKILRDVRGFRIYDGPSEVHRWSLGAKSLKRAQDAPDYLLPPLMRIPANSNNS